MAKRPGVLDLELTPAETSRRYDSNNNGDDGIPMSSVKYPRGGHVTEGDNNSDNKLELRLIPQNPKDGSANNIYERSEKWDGSQSSFDDGTVERDRLSAPRRLEK